MTMLAWVTTNNVKTLSPKVQGFQSKDKPLSRKTVSKRRWAKALLDEIFQFFLLIKRITDVRKYRDFLFLLTFSRKT